MKIQIRKTDGPLEYVELEGDLDFHSSPDLRRELTKLVERQTAKVLVDLKKVPYIDSSGLATFVELFQRMKRYGGKLVLYNLPPGVRSVFEISKLDTIFQLAGNEKDAVSLVS
jgi:anti-sigma B factor antagonist